jgi:hypothetical protein
MAEVGGYRQPSNPAPVSGPGALSKRTDGQPARYMSGGPYGEGQELMELQTSAPMASAPRQSVRPSRGRAPQGGDSAGVPVTPLFAPTERPDEPLTAGAPFGPGPSPAVRPAVKRGTLAATLQKLSAYDDTGVLSRWYRMSQMRGW